MSSSEPTTLQQAIVYFSDPDNCLNYVVARRWPNGVECPRCQSKKVSRIKARKVFDCDGCRYQFSVTAGTIFHDSHLPVGCANH